MAGGKSTPKKDKALKVSGNQAVLNGQILVRGIPSYKAGSNTRGIGTIYALCAGKIRFTKKKTSKGSVKTFINVLPDK